MQARMRQGYLFAVVAVALGVVLGGMVLAQGDPMWGAWKLNLAKSKYTGGPPPKSQTLTIEPSGNDGEKVTGDGIAADASRIAWSFTGNFDDKDAAFNAGSVGTPNGADAIAVKRIDSYKFDVTYKKAGKVIGTNKVSYSKDGKIRTATGNGMNAAGQPTSNVTVWDKQ